MFVGRLASRFITICVSTTADVAPKASWTYVCKRILVQLCFAVSILSLRGVVAAANLTHVLLTEAFLVILVPLSGILVDMVLVVLGVLLLPCLFLRQSLGGHTI